MAPGLQLLSQMLLLTPSLLISSTWTVPKPPAAKLNQYISSLPSLVPTVLHQGWYLTALILKVNSQPSTHETVRSTRMTFFASSDQITTHGLRLVWAIHRNGSIYLWSALICPHAWVVCIISVQVCLIGCIQWLHTCIFFLI